MCNWILYLHIETCLWFAGVYYNKNHFGDNYNNFHTVRMLIAAILYTKVNTR